jgi:hypothetical protein
MTGKPFAGKGFCVIQLVDNPVGQQDGRRTGRSAGMVVMVDAGDQYKK